MPCQQDSLYEAERRIEFPGDGAPAWGHKMLLAEAQDFVDRMRDRYRRWEGDFRHVLRVEVFEHPDGQGGSVGGFDAVKGAGVCDMMSDHMRPLILCHEVAHVLADARFGSQSHDPWMARIYLELVYACMGAEDYGRLQRSFDQHGVDYDVVLD